ncbi:MAG: MBL fold metallo-hydrolase [Verrucomicrobiota bacterium]
MRIISHAGGAQSLLDADLSGQAVGLAWLGQAGFLLRHAGLRVLIDPYLSDHLARKYAGTEFPHTRLMPPPIHADRLLDLDLVLCSHRHSDHADPGSLALLADANPACRFIVPRAELAAIAQLGVPQAQLVPVNTDDLLRVSDALEIRILPAAHESLMLNSHGEHYFLGFLLHLGQFTLYHSGDTLVYHGLAERLRQQPVDLALLPVNGRSEHLSQCGIAGNMTFSEAIDLCRVANIGNIIPHHFGMFAFNTADPTELRRQIERLGTASPRCLLPDVEWYYILS